MIKKYFLIFFLLTASLIAQNATEIYTSAMQEYEAKNYSKAHFLFESFFRDYKLKDEIFISAKFYSSQALLNMGQLEAAAEGFDFLVNNYKYNNYRDKSFYELGLIHFQLKKYEESRIYFQKLNEEYPSNELFGSVIFWIAESYSIENKYEDAINNYKESLNNKATNNYNDYAVFALASIYEKLGDYTNAVNKYDELLSHYKDSPLTEAAQIRIGVCYFHLKDYDSSILELENPIINNLSLEKQAEALYLLANSFYKIGEYDNAIKTYLDIISKYPSVKIIRDIRYTLGWSYFQLKKYNDAYNFFNSISDGTDTIAVNAFFWKAESKRYAGNENEALQLYETFIKRFPTEDKIYDVYYLMGVANYNKKSYEAAEQYLLDATKSSDQNTQAKSFVLLGEIELNKGKFTEALKYFETAKKFYTTIPDLENRSVLGCAVCNFYLKKYDDVIARLNEVSAKSPYFENDKINFYIAEALFAKEKYPEALIAYDKIESDDEKLQNPITYGKAYCYFNTNDYTNASYLFSDFVKLYTADPKLIDAKQRLGDSYFADKNYDDAIKTYGDILKSREKIANRDYVIYQYALALYCGGKTETSLNEFKLIKDNYRKSIYFENSFYMIGWINSKLKNYKDAIICYKNILAAIPNLKISSSVYYSLGDAYYNMAKYDSALVYYRIVLSDYPNSNELLDAINGIQNCYTAKKEPDKAANLLNNFVLGNPNFSLSDRLFLKRGDVYYTQKKYEKAKESYKEFITYFPKSKFIANAYYLIGKSCVNLNQTGEAIYNFKYVVDAYSETDIAQSTVIELSNILIAEKRFDEAIKYLDKASDKYKESIHIPEFKFLEASAYSEKGNTAAAYDLYDEIVVYYDGNIFADKSRMELGIIELNAKRYDNAIKYFQDLFSKRIDEYGAKAQYFCGVTYFQQNKINEAITAFIRVQNVFPKYDEWVTLSYLKLGDCYEKKGDIIKAKQILNSVIAKHPKDQYGKEAKNKLAGLKQ